MQMIQEMRDNDPASAATFDHLQSARLVRKNLKRKNTTGAIRALSSRPPPELIGETLRKLTTLYPTRTSTPHTMSPKPEHAPLLLSVADVNTFLVKKCAIKKASDASGWSLYQLREICLGNHDQHGSKP
jgi:hypothetical protein